MVIFITSIVGLLVIVEFGIRRLVQKLRKNFQWLITKEDENPVLPKEALIKFLNSSFDQQLGWVRKPNTIGSDKGKNGDIIFNIDSRGSRKSSRQELAKKIVVFGDSYAFCRQVKDDETWEEGITNRLNVGVLNYGVGNYGVDQALIRYRSIDLPLDIKVAVICFVPETISRIQSYWKHYLEFGNTFAFKPRFTLSLEGKLELVENIIKAPRDFENLKCLLPEIQKYDDFYLRKFRKYQFRGSYLISFFRAPRRHFALILSLLVRKKTTISGPEVNYADAFSIIMKDNIQEARDMYKNPSAIKLLKSILTEFGELAASRGHLPLVLVIPQMLDFFNDKSIPMPYSSFFTELSKKMNVIDMAKIFQIKQLNDIYIDDRYGGHLSAEGNLMVAEAVSKWLETTKILKP